MTVLSIDSGNRTKKAEDFIDEHNAVHAMLSDVDRTAFTAYRVRGIPTTVIVDHEGRAMFRHVGFMDGMQEQFEREIETLLAWMGEA